MTMYGLALTPKVYDAEMRRDRCGACERVLATGTTACVCGAAFVGAVRSEGR